MAYYPHYYPHYTNGIGPNAALEMRIFGSGGRRVSHSGARGVRGLGKRAYGMRVQGLHKGISHTGGGKGNFRATWQDEAESGGWQSVASETGNYGAELRRPVRKLGCRAVGSVFSTGQKIGIQLEADPVCLRKETEG
ncbi:hypothetical protein B0H13DRAFT_1854908 [Mycena leptocephala]|nr:hypothetical protein B0H13DRAFT_1854908 [Mycena leptocephala]